MRSQLAMPVLKLPSGSPKGDQHQLGNEIMSCYRLGPRICEIKQGDVRVGLRLNRCSRSFKTHQLGLFGKCDGGEGLLENSLCAVLS